jgi:hypothetical protein
MIWLQPKVCLTEEGLSQIRAPKRKAGQIRVRARNSIRFKPRAVNPRKCGGERRVRFVLRRGRALLFNIGVTSPKNHDQDSLQPVKHIALHRNGPPDIRLAYDCHGPRSNNVVQTVSRADTSRLVALVI